MFRKVWALLLTFGPSFSTAKNGLFLNEYCGPLRGKKSPCCMAKDWMIGGMVRLQATANINQNRAFSYMGNPKQRVFVVAETTHNLGILGLCMVKLCCRVLRKHQLGIGSKITRDS